MSHEDVTSNGANPGAGAARARRPALERTEPHRSWGNLYTPGKAYSPAAGGAASAPEAAREPAPSAPHDAAARVVRDGYRIVEENLRRGRQVAAELRGVRREVADFASRVDSPRVVSNLAQTLIDPALTEQLASVAKTLLSALGTVLPTPRPWSAPGADDSVNGQNTAEKRAPQPLHPQERSDYAPAGARILKMRRTAPGEWLADLEVDGQVRRVQVRALDGEL